MNEWENKTECYNTSYILVYFFYFLVVLFIINYLMNTKKVEGSE